MGIRLRSSIAAHERLARKHASRKGRSAKIKKEYHISCATLQKRFNRVLSRSERKEEYRYFQGKNGVKGTWANGTFTPDKK